MANLKPAAMIASQSISVNPLATAQKRFF